MIIMNNFSFAHLRLTAVPLRAL